MGCTYASRSYDSDRLGSCTVRELGFMVTLMYYVVVVFVCSAVFWWFVVQYSMRHTLSSTLLVSEDVG